MIRVWFRGWLAWCGVLAVALFVLVAFHSGARPAGATHLCGNTGSSQGPFDLRAYEDGNWRTTYSRTLVLAGHDDLFPDVSGFALPRLETGGRSAGSGQLTSPYIPPTLLKAIAWIESSWAQADYSVPYGAVGPALISHDCGYGIMQITSGMQNTSGAPNLEQAMIGGHYALNIARGARILAEKWNAAPTYRPIVGNRDRTIVENWYYAVWSYNGFSFKNHPLNPGFSLPRPVYRCDGSQPRSNYPYQELIFGCVVNPPIVGGQALWSPQAVSLPSLSDTAFNLANWNSCSIDRNCAAMDLATPNPSHTDPTNTSLTRSQVIGSPALRVSAANIELAAVHGDKSQPVSLTIANSGSGVLNVRISPSNSWLKVSRRQGVSLGSDLGTKNFTVTVRGVAGSLPVGTHNATIKVQSLYPPTTKTVNVTFRVFNLPDGTLLKGSGSTVYVIRSGLKRRAPNPVTFEANGLNWSAVLTIPDSALDALPAGRPLLDTTAYGNLLKASGAGVYVMEKGRRRLIKDPDVFVGCGYGWDAVRSISDAGLNSITTSTTLSGPPCPHLSPPSGSLVKGSSASVYVMRGGLKRRIPNPITFDAEAFLWGNINRIPDSSLDFIPTGYSVLNATANGNLLKASSAGVYVMENGRRRLINDPDVLVGCGYGWDAVRSISDAGLNSIPTGTTLSGPPCPHLSPPSGSLIKGSGATIYVMQGGLKRRIADPTTFGANGFLWGNINRIPDSSLDDIPTGHSLLDAKADGNLLKASSAGVYVMENGLRRLIKSPGVLVDCGYGWDAVKVISNAVLGSISSGSALTGPPCPQLSPRDGSLLQGSGSTIYVMLDGSKLLIASTDVFSDCGYAAGNINTIPDSMLDSIPDGLILTGQPCP